MNKGLLITDLENSSYLLADYTESYFKKLREMYKDIVNDLDKDYLFFAYTVLCASTLEYSLNHIIVNHFIREYGPIGYKRYADGYMDIKFANKLHATPILISNGRFYFVQDNSNIKALEELISLRNKIVHRKEYGQPIKMNIKDKKLKGGMDFEYADKNVIDKITKKQCIRFGEALGKFKSDLMTPYFNNNLIETDLLKNRK